MASTTVGSKIKTSNYGQQIVGILVLGVLAIFLPTPVIEWAKPQLQQMFHPGSKLEWGEERIAHIPAEFIRRSPLFAASWEALGVCLDRHVDRKCDDATVAHIVGLRDSAIRLDWPAVFDRLVIYDDWGEAEESAIARDDFFEALKEKGEETLRNHCLPIIRFEIESGGRWYHFGDDPGDDFVCT